MISNVMLNWNIFASSFPPRQRWGVYFGSYLVNMSILLTGWLRCIWVQSEWILVVLVVVVVVVAAAAAVIVIYSNETVSVCPSSPVFPSYLRYFSAGNNLDLDNEFLEVLRIWRMHGDSTSRSLNGILIRVLDYYFPMLLQVCPRHPLCFRPICNILVPGTTWSSMIFAVWWLWRIHGDNTFKSPSGIMIRVYDYYFLVLMKVHLRHLLCFALYKTS